MSLSDQEGSEDTKLHEAVRYGDLEEVRDALQLNLDPNQIGTYQWSALHEAANNGDADIVRLLIKYGGEPNKCDNLRGCTAVHYAASQGHEECTQLLLQAGGRYDVMNSDGETCLDVATGECRKLLQHQRDKDLLLHPPSKETLVNRLLEDTKHIILEGKSAKTRENAPAKNHKDINDNDSEQDSAMFDFDDISIATSDSTCSSISHRTWTSDKGWGSQKDLVLGSALMSFEYNSKKTAFKIRVWQIADLLLPPAETSMISNIYVKSFLQPDKRKDSKRKTEHLPIRSSEQPSDQSSQTETGRSVVFRHSTFKFTKALEYSKITPEVVKSCVVQIMVCVVQKYTRKSYPVATWNMPLQQAVRKLVKEKYSLTPCLSLNIPTNMKVYHAGQLQVTHSLQHSSSNPSLQRLPSDASWAVPYSERAVSDSNLHGVTVDKEGYTNVPSIEITLAEEKEEEELNEALQQIAVMEGQEQRRAQGQNVKIQLGELLPGTVEDGDELTGVVVSNTMQVAEVQVHVAAQRETPAPTILLEQSIDMQVMELNAQKQKKKDSTKSRRKSSAQLEKKKRSSISKEAESERELGSVSRPDTPTWDKYTEPLSVAMVPMDFEDDLPLPMDDRSHLPMAVSLEMPEIHRSFSRSKDIEKAESSFISSAVHQVRYEDDFTRQSNEPESFPSHPAQPLQQGYTASRSPRSKQKTQSESYKAQEVHSAGDYEQQMQSSKTTKKAPFKTKPSKTSTEQSFEMNERLFKRHGGIQKSGNGSKENDQIKVDFSAAEKSDSEKEFEFEV